MESIKKSRHEASLNELTKVVVASSEDQAISMIKIHKFIISVFR